MTTASRVYFRLPCEFRVKYEKGEKGGSRSGKVRACDISTNGIGFLTPVSFQIGEILIVSFRLPCIWRNFKLKAEVRHQTIKKTAPKTLYLTGIQFAPETDSAMIRDIGNFIVRETNFLGIRFAVLCVAVFLALLAAVRALNINQIHYYLGTAAGAEWFPSAGWWKSALEIYVTGNFIFAAALIAAGLGFAMIGTHARKIMGSLILLTALGQLGRIIFKAGFVSRDFFFQWIYTAEILILAVSACFFFLLTRKKFSARFDSYRQNLENHLQY